jgi:hypothetical protein
MWRAVLAVRGTPSDHDAVAAVDVVDVTAPHVLAVALEDAAAPVVVAGHPIDATAARTACSLLVAHRPDVPVTLWLTAHTTGATLAALRLARAATDDAGHGMRILADTLNRTWSAVVLDSVARLEHPNPTLGQHLRSWLPGTRFVVRQGPRPRAVAASAVTSLLEGVPRAEHDLLVDAGATDDPVTRAVVTAVAPERTLPLGIPVTDTARRYGRRERFELSLLPRPGIWSVPGPATRCPGCGLSVPGQVCVFCRTTGDVPGPPPGDVVSAGPVLTAGVGR